MPMPMTYRVLLGHRPRSASARRPPQEPDGPERPSGAPAATRPRPGSRAGPAQVRREAADERTGRSADVEGR